MKAYILTEDGPRLAEVDQPSIASREILVAVRANALNHADLGMAAGRKHGSRGGVGTILGSEWAGEIVAVGSGETRLRIGDRVMGVSGGFASFVAADPASVLPMPQGMSFEQAACLPVALCTMHNAIASVGRVQPGDAVLIQGASSAVGLMGMQIATIMGAAVVIGSSTNVQRRARLGEFGADLAIDSAAVGWVQEVLDFTGGVGVDLLIDQVSGDLINKNMSATRLLGTIVNVGRLGGREGAFNFDLHALRRVTYVGVTFRTRTRDEIAEIIRLAVKDLWPPLERGDLRMPIDSRFPLAQIDQAFDRMRRNEHFGKIVVLH